MIRRIATGLLAGLIAGLAVGFLPTLSAVWWLTHQAWWPLGESPTLVLVWTPWAIAGEVVGAMCGWRDHRTAERRGIA